MGRTAKKEKKSMKRRERKRQSMVLKTGKERELTKEDLCIIVFERPRKA